MSDSTMILHSTTITQIWHSDTVDIELKTNNINIIPY